MAGATGYRVFFWNTLTGAWGVIGLTTAPTMIVGLPLTGWRLWTVSAVFLGGAESRAGKTAVGGRR